MKPATLRDVAEAANISTTAVSRVLHGGGASVRVSEERAAQIREAAARLNYRVNAVARNLRKSRTNTIGVLFENLKGLGDGPLYTTCLLDGVSSVLFQQGYRLSLLAEIDHSDLMGSLGDGQLDGVIWCKLARDADSASILRDMPIPIVAINASEPNDDAEALFVNCDNVGGIHLAIDHLIGLGHQRIAFLSEAEESDTPDRISRRDAYVSQMLLHGLEPVELECPWNLQGAVAEILERKSTAVVCWTERLAGHLLDSLREQLISVPRQLSVIGFDSTRYCETTSPRLTAVRQPIREMAAFATETLLGMIRREDCGFQSRIFPCQLDVRASTAAPEVQ